MYKRHDNHTYDTQNCHGRSIIDYTREGKGGLFLSATNVLF